MVLHPLLSSTALLVMGCLITIAVLATVLLHREAVKVSEAGNPPKAPVAPYIVAVITITLATVSGVVLVLTIRPDKDNAMLVTQMLGFGTTTLAATLAYMRSTETREIVNSRMDEFKRALELASAVAQARAHDEGEKQGRTAADARTDALAGQGPAGVSGGA